MNNEEKLIEKEIVPITYTRKHPIKKADVSVCLQAGYSRGFSNNNPYPAVAEITEPNVLKQVRTEYGKEIRKAYEAGEIQEKWGNMKQFEPRTDGISNTLSTVPKDNYLQDGTLRIRKLTPKECFRLMGFDDEDFSKAEAVNSNTQLYKQAGNSICVPVLEYIISALFDCGAWIKEKGESKEMELKMNEYQLPEKISFNYEELKQELMNKVEMYTNLVYTEEQIGDAKKDKANLNKLKKALNDERIRLRKEYMEPFNVFKGQIDEIISIIDKPVLLIDKQVKEYEEKQKADKKAAIEELFGSIGFQDFVTLQMIWDEKWLNATTSMKKIEEAMKSEMYRIGNDILTLSKLPEFGFEATQIYKSTLDVNKAISEAQRMAEMQKKKAEHEAEMKARAEEQARLVAEAEAKKQEELPMDFDRSNDVVEHPTIENPQPPAKQWISFSALLSTEDALALKDFFNSRNIEFKAV